MAKFETLAVAEIHKATEIITQHTAEGENDLVSLDQMFPHGIQDILFVIWQKTGRALGYEHAGNFEGVARELPDIINYAGFGLALLNSVQEQTQ